MASIALRGLVKRYGTVRAVEKLDLDVASGEFVTIGRSAILDQSINRFRIAETDDAGLVGHSASPRLSMRKSRGLADSPVGCLRAMSASRLTPEVLTRLPAFMSS